MSSESFPLTKKAEDSGYEIVVQSTPDNSNPLRRKSKKVRVIGTLKQITGNKKIGEWMVSECNYHAHFTSSLAKDNYRLMF